MCAVLSGVPQGRRGRLCRILLRQHLRRRVHRILELAHRLPGYTVEVYWDIFPSEGLASVRGHVARDEGDRQIALIRRCATP